MNVTQRVLLFALAMVLLPSGAVLSAQQAAELSKLLPVLVVTGENNHDCEYTTDQVVELLEKTGRFEVTVTEDPSADLANARFAHSFRAIFLDYNGKRWGKAAENNFVAAVKWGVGVVVMHAANNAFEGWEAYEKICALCWRKDTGHGAFHKFDVDVVDRNHPITWDLPDMKAHPDELYHGLEPMHQTPYRTLMSARSSQKSGGSGKVEPMVLIHKYGKGRVFHTPLGHVWRNTPATRASMQDKQLRLLLARGTEWAATGKVTIKPEKFGVEAMPLPASSGRAHDPFVFRCVLDGRPRVAVVALQEKLWVSYDLAKPGLHKIWAGGIELVGSVYDGAHGPQPKTRGKALLEFESPTWQLQSAPRGPDGEPGILDVVLSYEGYRLRKSLNRKVVHFEYRLRRSGRQDVVVVEFPEVVMSHKPQLLRSFSVRGLAEGEKLVLREKAKYMIDRVRPISPLRPKIKGEEARFEFYNGSYQYVFEYKLQGGL
ncbi:MAG: ThuA domain-containing protein [Planctomycetota bacterium]